MTAKASFDQDMIRSQIDTMDHISHGSGVAPSTFQNCSTRHIRPLRAFGREGGRAERVRSQSIFPEDLKAIGMSCYIKCSNASHTVSLDRHLQDLQVITCRGEEEDEQSDTHERCTRVRISPSGVAFGTHCQKQGDIYSGSRIFFRTSLAELERIGWSAGE